jgi:hypothetical protein
MCITKNRLVKLNLSQYISQNFDVLLCLMYFISNIMINKYFYNYINQTVLSKSYNYNNQTVLSNLYNPIRTNPIQTNTNLYNCQICNYICFCSFLYVPFYIKNKLKNGIFYNNKLSLMQFICFVNYLIKGILSMELFCIVVKKINNQQIKLNFPENIIWLSIVFNAMSSFIFISSFIVIIIAAIISTLCILIFNILNYYAETITFYIEETYIIDDV